VVRYVEFSTDTAGERLDRYVADSLPEISRSQVQRMIRDGAVTIDGQAAKPSQRLVGGQVVRVSLAEEKPYELLPWPIPLSVVYEDPDCVVIDKPPGLVVHPATSHQQDTLVNALLARYPELAQMADPSTEMGRRPGIVHRLDKDTSGLIVVARSPAARKMLQRQFRERSVEKVYLALLYGRLSSTAGSIYAPMGRDPRNRQRMAVVAEGRTAETSYVVRAFLMQRNRSDLYTLIEARLITGRTHQIRVHLAYVGHPVVGDAVYGRRKQPLACPRQFLHACSLSFARPSDGRRICLESSLPEDLAAVLSQLEAII
jgi:23S rRNA pseudouridine1911/1915/1917 synthase